MHHKCNHQLTAKEYWTNLVQKAHPANTKQP